MAPHELSGAVSGPLPAASGRGRYAADGTVLGMTGVMQDITARRSADFPAFWEAVLSALLIGSAIFVYATNGQRVHEIDLYALVLAVQSLPFLASVALATLEGTRANDFAFWRGIEARFAELLTRRPAAVAKAPAPAPIAADERVETAQ